MDRKHKYEFTVRYDRVGEIWKDLAPCHVCHKSGPVVAIDSSEGEYGPGYICGDCVCDILGGSSQLDKSRVYLRHIKILLNEILDAIEDAIEFVESELRRSGGENKQTTRMADPSIADTDE